MISDNKTLDKVYTATNKEELMAAYKEWAENYEKDTVDRFGYKAYIVSADALEKLLDSKDVKILDAGCGTGLVGQELAGRGFRFIDALDYNGAMLDQARKKGVYQSYTQADLSKPLHIEDNAYDALNCTGTLTYGHVRPDVFNEFIRVTKPSGIVCFTVREGAYEDYGYRDRMLELEQQKSWELIGLTDACYFENEGEDTMCKLCTYRVLS